MVIYTTNLLLTYEIIYISLYRDEVEHIEASADELDGASIAKTCCLKGL